MVVAESLQWAWRCQVEDGRQLISCAVFVNFKLCHCKLNVWTSKYSLFLLDTAGHTRTPRGPDVARGPDVVHRWPMHISRQTIRANDRAAKLDFRRAICFRFLLLGFQK